MVHFCGLIALPCARLSHKQSHRFRQRGGHKSHRNTAYSSVFFLTKVLCLAERQPTLKLISLSKQAVFLQSPQVVRILKRNFSHFSNDVSAISFVVVVDRLQEYTIREPYLIRILTYLKDGTFHPDLKEKRKYS